MNDPDAGPSAPRVGLVGCGRWGTNILRDLLDLGASVHVATRGERPRAAVVRSVVEDLRDLPELDGYVVATPTSTHADVLEALLPRGVPIFCEKPLCDDAARARALASAGEGRLFVMEKWRYHRGVKELAMIARSGELGRVIGLRTTRVGYGHHYTDVDCTWILLPHDISIAYEILGTLPVPRHAVADRSGSRVLGLTAISGADGEPWHVVEVSARARIRQRKIELFCSEGTAILDDGYAHHITLTANPPADGPPVEPRLTRRSIPEEMPLRAELEAFLAHLAGGPPPISSAAEGARVVETIATMRRLAGV